MHTTNLNIKPKQPQVNLNYSLQPTHLFWHDFKGYYEKNMKLICALLGLMIIPIFYASGQMNEGTDYKTALGVKIYPGAFSIKHFYTANTAIEGLGYLSSDGFRITGLYEMHKDLNKVEGLKGYVGAGGHVGIWSEAWKTKYPERKSGMAIGIDGVIGLDYKIKGVPLNLSFDWQPSFNIIGYTHFEGGWGGLAIRYTF